MVYCCCVDSYWFIEAVLCSYTVNENRLFTGKYKHNIKGRCKYAITYIYYIYLLNHSNIIRQTIMFHHTRMEERVIKMPEPPVL